MSDAKWTNEAMDAARYQAQLDAQAEELARVTAILNRCTGALVDAGTVPTEDIEAGIRALIQERAQAQEYCKQQVQQAREEQP